MSKLLIVIPAHNEEENIASVVEDLTTRYPQYDYIVVNDGSRDKTAAICRAHGMELIRVENSYARRYQHIKAILEAYFKGSTMR